MKSFFSWATEINLENLFVLSVKINGIVKQKKKSCMFNKLYYVHDNNSFMTLLPFFCYGCQATSNITGTSHFYFLLIWFQFSERKFLAKQRLNVFSTDVALTKKP